MSVDAKAKGGTRRRGVRGEPVFMTKSQLAHEMGQVDTQTIDRWIAAGTVPPPHSRPGESTALWRRSDFEHYVATGRWPKEAFRSSGSREVT